MLRSSSKSNPKRGGRKNRPSGAVAVPASGLKSELRRRFNGLAVTPQQDPPDVIDVPWNTLTINYGGTASAGYTNYRASTLVATLAAQLSITTPDTHQLEIRVLSFRAWALTGPRIGYRAYDYTPRPVQDGNATVLKEQEDAAAKNHWARVGFIWPASAQNVVLRSEPTPVFDLEVSAAGEDVTVRVNILWRTAPVGIDRRILRRVMPLP